MHARKKYTSRGLAISVEQLRQARRPCCHRLHFRTVTKWLIKVHGESFPDGTERKKQAFGKPIGKVRFMTICVLEIEPFYDLRQLKEDAPRKMTTIPIAFGSRKSK